MNDIVSLYSTLKIILEKIIFKYNSKKIIGFIFLCIFFLLFFGYGLLNATELSLKEPLGFSRYSWVGKLAYQKPKLIFTTSLLLGVLFFILLLDLIFKLIKKTFVISKNNNKLYLNNKYLINIDNIQRVDLVNYNKNSSVYLYLVDIQKFLNTQNSTLKILKYKFFFFCNKNALRINLSFFKGKTSENFEKLKKVIRK